MRLEIEWYALRRSLSTTERKPIVSGKLQATNGHIIAGTQVDSNRFIGRVTFAQLSQIAPDPRDTENKKKFDASQELQYLFGIREEVQRAFEGAKKKNVPLYADYIIELKNGEDGITPPITLYVEKQLEVEEREDGCSFIQIPWDQRLVAIDGETQLAARHAAAEVDLETKQMFVPIYICHGYDKAWARQAFHDLNALAVKPNVAITLGMDARDPVTAITRRVERDVPFLRNRVNKVRRQLRSSDIHVLTLTALRAACVTLAKGITGVQLGNRTVAMTDAEAARAQEVAVEWFTAVTEAIGPAMEDRDHKLAAAPAVLAAIGAMGHRLLQVHDDGERRAMAVAQAASLKKIDWTRSPIWAGIAGKVSLKGTLSVGGAKENAYAVYSALADEAQPAYKAIRSSEPVQAAQP